MSDPFLLPPADLLDTMDIENLDLAEFADALEDQPWLSGQAAGAAIAVAGVPAPAAAAVAAAATGAAGSPSAAYAAWQQPQPAAVPKPLPQPQAAGHSVPAAAVLTALLATAPTELSSTCSPSPVVLVEQRTSLPMVARSGSVPIHRAHVGAAALNNPAHAGALLWLPAQGTPCRGAL
jgi:hypothetical protein